MSDAIYKKLKRQNGEAFARTLRDHHNGLLEIPNLPHIVRYAGRGKDDATAVIPHLMHLLIALDEDVEDAEANDPFELLNAAGYEAFHADTLQKQNSITSYFEKDELLCTFNDAARHEDYHIIHAIKKNARDINRENFRGKEDRQDKYGTSVISIQILKEGGFISIKNRYNSTVDGCDHTFSSNPNAIIKGLTPALKNHFNIEFTAPMVPLPSDYVLQGEQLFKYNEEYRNFYYGDQSWAKDGIIHRINRGHGDALFDRFLFDNKSKTLQNIDPESIDSFPQDFNNAYGGNQDLKVDTAGNLTLNGDILIGAENSRIKTIDLPALKTMSRFSLQTAKHLTTFRASALETMSGTNLTYARQLKTFHTPALQTIGTECLRDVPSLTMFYTPSLEIIGGYSLSETNALSIFYAPKLRIIQSHSLMKIGNLRVLKLPALEKTGFRCFSDANALTTFDAPSLEIMGDHSLCNANSLTMLNIPKLRIMRDYCLSDVNALTIIEAPALQSMGEYCLYSALALHTVNASQLQDVHKTCMHYTPRLEHMICQQPKPAPIQEYHR
jgi:hypothetical protein